MELSAITQWNSIGKDLYGLADIEQEVARANEHRQSQLKQLGELRRIKHEIEAKERQQSASDHALRYVRRFLKGFLVGWGAKSAFMVLPAVLKSKSNLTKIWKTLKRVLHTDQTSVGVFLGSYICIFHFIMRLLRNDTGLVGKYRAIIAAFIASYSIRVTPRETQVAVGSFLIVRSCDIWVRYAANRGYFGERLSSWAHWDVAVMSIASAQVVWAGLLNTPSVSKAYMNFLQRQSGLNVNERLWLTSTLRGKPDINLLGKFNPGPRIEKALPVTFIRGPPWPSPPFTLNMFPRILSIFEQCFKRSIPVYLPVYGIPLILFRFKRLLTQPLAALSSSALGISRSSLFLSTYVTTAWAVLSVLIRYFPNGGPSGHIIPTIAGLLSGTSLLVEKKPRRIEIALYVLGQAYQSFFRTWHILFPVFKHPGQILLAVSCAAIMYVYSSHPELIRPNYFRPLNYLFGSDFASWARVTSLEEAYLSSIDLPSLLKNFEKEGVSMGFMEKGGDKK